MFLNKAEFFVMRKIMNKTLMDSITLWGEKKLSK